MGKVPAIVHRGVVVTECAAICVYLADAYPKAGLAPALDDPQRGTYLRWIFFGAGCVEPALVDKMFDRPPVERKGALGYGSYDDTLNALETAITPGPFILGDRFSAADVYVGSQIQWGMMVKGLEPRPEFQQYAERLAARPAHAAFNEGGAVVVNAIVQKADVIERAKRVGALARQHAKESEELGKLADPVAEALHKEGLLGMWVPRTLRGGLELDPVSSLEVIESVSYGDPSAGWVLMAASLAIGTGAAYLKDDAVKELFSGARFPVIAGQGTRPGTAKPTKGGFNLTGSWSFASGIKHGTHIHTLGLIEGTNEARIFVLPVGKAKLIDNWDVLGLRATGSIDYTTDNVFVPEAYTHLATTEEPLRGGNLYRIGIIGFAGLCHSGWACGIGRRVLDELIQVVAEKAGRPGTLADSASFQEQLADAEAVVRSARAFVYETWNDASATLARGDKLSVRQNSLIRLALAHATWSAHEAATFAYKAAGTQALRAGTIQHLFRDMHAGTQHITSSPPVYASIGRELGGLAKGKKWLFLNLVDQ